MAQSLARRLRAAADPGLTSPDRSAPRARMGTRPQTPAQEPADTPQNRQRQAKHARKQFVEASDRNAALGIQPVDRG